MRLLKKEELVQVSGVRRGGGAGGDRGTEASQGTSASNNKASGAATQVANLGADSR